MCFDKQPQETPVDGISTLKQLFRDRFYSFLSEWNAVNFNQNRDMLE
jgi:hypothetical protein